jgi:hypothetical protein
MIPDCGADIASEVLTLHAVGKTGFVVCNFPSTPLNVAAICALRGTDP